MDWYHKYAMCGLTYGVARKAVQLSRKPRIETRQFDPLRKKYVTRDALVIEKAVTMVVGASMSSMFLPVYASIDLAKLECHLRGLDHEGDWQTYGCPVDMIFA
jgi:hypothetical protein